MSGIEVCVIISCWSLSHFWLFSNPWSAACQASLSFTISHSWFNSCPLSWWSHPTISPCHRPLLMPSVFPSIRVFSDESALCIRWPKYWSFSFGISPSNEYSGLIFFRIDLFYLAVQALSRIFSNTTVQKHQFFNAQPSLWSNSYIHTWLLDYQWLSSNHQKRNCLPTSDRDRWPFQWYTLH